MGIFSSFNIVLVVLRVRVRAGLIWMMMVREEQLLSQQKEMSELLPLV